MSEIGEIKYDIVWKWWVAPVLWSCELPVLRNWVGFRGVACESVIARGLIFKGPL